MGTIKRAGLASTPPSLSIARTSTAKSALSSPAGMANTKVLSVRMVPTQGPSSTRIS